MGLLRTSLSPLIACLLLGAGPASSQPPFITFESGHVRPIALSPDGSKLYVVNTPDNRLEIFAIDAGSLSHTDSVPVGMEPVAVAALDDANDDRVWVVNHLSDSVSIVDLSASPPRVVAHAAGRATSPATSSSPAPAAIARSSPRPTAASTARTARSPG